MKKPVGSKGYSNGRALAQVYNRYTCLDEMREAIDLWGQRLAKLVVR